MTAKEFVKERLPNAHAKRQVQGRIKGLQEIYWLIRDGNKTMYIVTGKTESNAWVKCKKWLLTKENI